MPAIASAVLAACIALLVAGIVGPRCLRTSLFDKRPMSTRAATSAEEEAWKEIRQRLVAGAEHFRRLSLWIALLLGLLAVIVLVLS